MAENYGASLEAWHHWGTTLRLTEHLLPVISNPGATISPDSNVKKLGKTPSRYNFRKEAAGFAKWTEHRATAREVGRWEMEPDYGICVQAREVRAIDIDVPDKRKAKAILDVIENVLPLCFFPQRYREGTGKVLLAFRFEDVMPKRVIPVDGGIIEFLGDGQQWVAEGSYLTDNPRVSGRTNTPQVALGRYLWRGGWPVDFPALSPGELEALWETLVMLFANGEPQIARQRRAGSGVDTRPITGLEDPVAQYIAASWEIRDYGRDGELCIRCPFDAEHSSDSGPTETVYYVAGTGGYEKGHFKCLHAHCMSRTDADYLEAIGFAHDMSDAPSLPAQGDAGGGSGDGGNLPEKGAALRYMVDKQGRREGRAYNHRLFLNSEECGKHIAWDDFSAQIVWCPVHDKKGKERWQLFSDEHYVDLVEQMDRHGFVPQQPSTIRAAVLKTAMHNRVDLAVAWIERLPAWDGVPRIETFWPRYAAATDTRYTRAVGLYSWTAQAARVLDPGCQADMTPILVSPEQGTRKTSFIRAIAPSADMFVEINLMARDNDTSRLMRGALVGELGELRGLKGRAVEDIKAFLTRREEKWTPKYGEFVKAFKRRLLFYGSTNEEDFLGDPTGERRYLPFYVGGDHQLDVEGVERDREQLWAEAVAIWRSSGVQWHDAERLAKFEHAKFKSDLEWTDKVRAWLLTPGALHDPEKAPVDMPFEWGLEDVAAGIGQPSRRGEAIHIGKVLKLFGALKPRQEQGRTRRYAVPRENVE